MPAAEGTRRQFRLPRLFGQTAVVALCLASLRYPEWIWISGFILTITVLYQLRMLIGLVTPPDAESER